MIVVNLFGAPSAGKSTLAMSLASYLKKNKIKAEYVSEVAKDYIWMDSEHLLIHQNLIFAQQELKLAVLKNKVDIVVSDAPLLNASFYAPRPYFESFHQLCLDHFKSYRNVNFFIERDHPYSEVGRLQTEEESIEVNEKMKTFLVQHHIELHCLKTSEWSAETAYQMIVDDQNKYNLDQ